MGFKILIYCFVQRLSYLLCCTPLYSIFIESLVSFDYFLLQMFGCLLGLGSFDNLEIPLVHKHAYLPITLGGIELIPTTTINVTILLKNYITLIIVVRFMINQRPFLLETLARIDNNTFLV